MKNAIKNSRSLFTGFLLSGVYTIAACTYDTIPTPSDCSNPPVLNILASQDTDCNQERGSISVSATGDTDTYIFRLNDEAENNTGVFNNLKAGVYTVTAEDTNGCTGSIEVEIRNVNGLNINIDLTHSDCGSSTGRINVAAQGGIQPYKFKINDQAFQAPGTFEQLGTGEYTIVAVDDGGCEVSQTVRILSDVVFGDIKPIIATNCAVSNCHDGSISPDLRNDQSIQSRANRIRARTGNSTMPPASSGRTLSSSEIENIACWVGDGASL